MRNRAIFGCDGTGERGGAGRRDGAALRGAAGRHRRAIETGGGNPWNIGNSARPTSRSRQSGLVAGKSAALTAGSTSFSFGARSSKRSRAASPASTPRKLTAWGSPSKPWRGRSTAVVRMSVSSPSSEWGTRKSRPVATAAAPVSWRRSRRACKGYRRTISTSISFIGRTPTRRSTRRCALSTTSCSTAKRAILACRTSGWRRSRAACGCGASMSSNMAGTCSTGACKPRSSRIARPSRSASWLMDRSPTGS